MAKTIFSLLLGAFLCSDMLSEEIYADDVAEQAFDFNAGRKQELFRQYQYRLASRRAVALDLRRTRHMAKRASGYWSGRQVIAPVHRHVDISSDPRQRSFGYGRRHIAVTFARF